MWKRYSLILVSLLGMSLFPQSAFAVCGATDYTGGSAKLTEMVVYILALATYVLDLVYAIAAVLCIYGATDVYIKMQNGEPFVKSIYVLVGACIFLLSATIVLPAFFGFRYGTVVDSFW